MSNLKAQGLNRAAKKTILGYLLLSLWVAPFPAYSLEKVSAVYTSISGGYAPLCVGKEKQAFEPYGLDVRLIYMRGTIPTSAALAVSAASRLSVPG